MSDQKLEAEVKRLNARIGALEKLLERINLARRETLEQIHDCL